MPQQNPLCPSYRNHLFNGAFGFGLELLGTQKDLSVTKLYSPLVICVKSVVGPCFIFLQQPP